MVPVSLNTPVSLTTPVLMTLVTVTEKVLYMKWVLNFTDIFISSTAVSDTDTSVRDTGYSSDTDCSIDTNSI